MDILTAGFEIGRPSRPIKGYYLTLQAFFRNMRAGCIEEYRQRCGRELEYVGMEFDDGFGRYNRTGRLKFKVKEEAKDA